MQLWRLFFLICLVNFPALAAAADSSTSIRGPRALDQQSRVQQLGPITPTDTLWRLAQQVRPEGADMYQVMYAIYLKNPHAFLDNNFNHLRTGAMLDVPSLREIRAVDPAEARQKSSADDQSWARRTPPTQTPEAQPATAAASQALQEQLAQLEQEQQQQLQQLRHRFGESMLLVEGIMVENQGLKETLDAVQQQLDALKAQMEEDNALQRELEQMVRMQAEWMALQQAEQIEAAQQSGFAQRLLTSPVFWALAASVPALGILLGFLLWIKRRSKKAQETIQAATSEPLATAGYQSPLPEVDDNMDVDDSLFSLDDSLLDDAFNDDVDDTPVDLSDDLLDDDILLDDSSVGSDSDALDEDDLLDDALLDDDSLLADDALTDNDALPDDDLLADVDQDDNTETAAEFDPDNILSGTDLDSLFNEADDDTEQSAAVANDFDDELLEEIELDIPEDDIPEQAELSDTEDPEDFADALLDQVAEDSNLAAESNETELDPDEAAQFDSSELDAFAESLVEETLQEPAETALADMDELTEVDAVEPESETELEAELEAEPEAELEAEPEPELEAEPEAELEAELEAEPEAELEGEPEAELAVEPEAELEAEPEAGLEAEPEPDPELMEAMLTEPLDEDLVLSEQEAPLSEEQALEREAATEAEYLEDFAELEDDFPADAMADESEAPNLSEQDDESVSPPSAASRSVENPSEVLDSYPELELDDAIDGDVLSQDSDDDMEQSDEDASEPEVQLADEVANELAESADLPSDKRSDNDEQAEQDPLAGEDGALQPEQAVESAKAAEDVFDDSLLDEQDEAELLADEPEEQLVGNENEADFDDLLSELEQMAERVANQSESEASAATAVSEEQAADLSDDDFQDIDQLLEKASARADSDSELDLGFELDDDYQQVLEQSGLDEEHDTYGAQLDLIRAYLEIDDHDSADQLIKEVLNSDAPDAIKDSVRQLQSGS
ncbi:FimV/HubP family polar landmark protein [Alkalimonas delamerensis]|uniref:FimV/HubP family polar landmark protein n=1 Tax=Alkalimonas delamerensis TaxID=265981 RepID=A0ABT9GSI6_9GAMM|nr:FimV/HubP family polar landmark protein [Alkalimonas delamerensis]MDP4529941.1 FimV/HubP family polar landmark protein [Alkalimonas delamerensis]